jgi:hypothetical protein
MMDLTTVEIGLIISVFMSIGVAWLYNNNGTFTLIAKTGSFSTMIERQFTYTELGL